MKTIKIVSSIVILLMTALALPGMAGAADLKVMMTGLGAGTVTSNPAGINCGADCDETYGASAMVTLTASSAGFSKWEGDCSGTVPTCLVAMSASRSVRAEFNPAVAIPTLTSFTVAGIQAYLMANPTVTTAAQFIKALPSEYKQNWILMSRSESLQTGTAKFPRILLPSANAQFVFSVGMATHSAYPGAHPNAIEYMQWDPGEKNFRFHEIVLDTIGAMGTLPTRSRGVSIDDNKCSKCHSTRNVLNRTSSPGTTGFAPGTIKFKNKPNWDSYDSWGGMLPFNRDRIYQGSVEAAAFRKTLNVWTWRTNAPVRSIIEQLDLQPSGVPPAHAITRTNGGANDGHINFGFDAAPPVLNEPAPAGTSTISTAYSFDGALGAGAATPVMRDGVFLTVHHSSIPGSDEGRGVHFFDLLGGFGDSGTNLNAQRIADELIDHRFATGSVPVDVRPIALAITKQCLSINAAANTVTSTPALTVDLGFFNARNGMGINDLLTDTRTREQSLPRRKADLQKLNLDRTNDPYLVPDLVNPTNGLVQEFGATTFAGTDASLTRLRKEVFRRSIDLGAPDATVMGGIYVDREFYLNGKFNTELVTLYRYFLEPLGVSVDKWSMGVRGRSRAYTFADVFSRYISTLQTQLEASMTSNPIPGLAAPFDCAALILAVNNTLASALLPPAAGPGAVPKYTDVQRIFNKSCIECHGGLGYPPYVNFGTTLDLSENEFPVAGVSPMTRPHGIASVLAMTLMSPIYRRITRTDEGCPFGLMPCGGPALSKTDIETIRRWIEGGSLYTEGDPHIKTIDGTFYDFQSAGEFVLLRDENLEIQTRQKAVQTEAPLAPNSHTGLRSCVSVNSAVAVRVGTHRITYQPNLNGEPDPNGLQLRIDGKLTALSAQEILLASGGRILRTSAPGGIQIESPGGTTVVITPGWWDYYRLWYMNIDARHARATEGVMGAIAPQNWLPALPDGSFLGPRPRDLHQRYVDLYGKFANAWRVSTASTLFDYAPGTSTETFTIANWPVEEPKNCIVPQPEGTPIQPPVKPLALEVAQQHCSAVVADDRRANCIQDVMVTGEQMFAKTYLLTEQIERNKIPAVPALAGPADNKIDLVKPVTFTWANASDSDGDPVIYRLCVWAVEAAYDFSRCDTPAGPSTLRVSGIRCAVLVALIGSVLFVVLIAVGAIKNRRYGIWVVLAILIAVVIAFYFCKTGTGTSAPPLSRSVTELESGKAYFWKVIAQDNQGGSTESETWRFTTKK